MGCIPGAVLDGLYFGLDREAERGAGSQGRIRRDGAETQVG